MFNLRKIIVELSYKKQLGHVGSALSCVELLTAIFKTKKKNDKFILSKGHAILAYYALMVSLKKVKLSTLLNKTVLSLHPSIYHPPCPDWSTGSLGHGLSVAIGFSLIDLKTFVLMSEGEFNEGSTWEAVLFAGEHKLKIIILIDINKWQATSRGFKSLDIPKLNKKLKAFGWFTDIVDGHNQHAITNSLNKAKYPYAILANTIKGKGVKSLEDTLSSHYYAIDEKSYAAFNA